MISEDALFIVNPISGKGPRAKDRIVSFLRSEGCRLAFTTGPGHATILAREAGCRLVVAVGGDGTVNEVAEGLDGSDCIMGIIPCGSGNSLARHLGISMNYRKAFRTLSEGTVKTMDGGIIDGRPFWCVSGVGLDAMVSEAFAKAGSRGLWTYVKQSLKLWRDFRPQHYSLTLDGRRIERSAALIAVNNTNQWGNNARVAPQASVLDGLLDVTVLSMFHTAEVPLLLLRLFNGTFYRNRRVECFRASELEIHRDTPGPLNCDGECLEGGEVVRISVRPARLKVLSARTEFV